MKKRILHLIISFGNGGVENGIRRLCLGLQDQGFDFDVLQFSQPTKEGILYNRRSPILFTMPPGKQYKRIFQFAMFLKKTDYSIIHTHNYETMAQGVPAAKLAGKKVLHGEHGSFGNVFLKKKHRLFQKILGRMANHNVAISKPLYNEIINKWGINQDNVSFIPNGVDTQRFQPLQVSHQDFHVCTIGRIEKVKNIECLIKGYNVFIEKVGDIDSKLFIIGDGSESDYLKKIANTLKISDMIEFTGYVNNPESWLQRCSVYVNTSHLEGMCNSILEAMACSLPVIASDIPGNRALVSENENGLLFRSNNYIELGENLYTLYKNKQIYKEISENNRQKILTTYNNDHYVESYKKLYDKILFNN